MKKFILFCLVLLCSMVQVQAGAYRSVMLEEMGQLLAEHRLEGVAAGLYSCDKIVGGKNYRIVTEGSCVVEMGLVLFDREMLGEDNALLVDFVERYMLYMLLLPSDRVEKYVNEDKVSIKCNALNKNGTLKDRMISSLKVIDSNSSLMIDKDSKNISVMWMNSKMSVMSITLPVDIFLLTGLNKKEIGDDFIAELKKYIADKNKEDIEFISPTEDMLIKGDNGLYVMKRNKHLIDILVSDNYYAKTGEVFTPIYNAKYPIESMSNLFTIPIDRDIDVELVINKYGYEKEEMKVKLFDLISFLKYYDCETFVGVEESKGSHVIGTSMAVNIGLAYAHILFFDFDLDIFKNKSNKKMKIEINSYIPTHNLKSLFEVNITKKK